MKLGDSGFATKIALIGTGAASVRAIAAVFGIKELLKTRKD